MSAFCRLHNRLKKMTYLLKSAEDSISCLETTFQHWIVYYSVKINRNDRALANWPCKRLSFKKYYYIINFCNWNKTLNTKHISINSYLLCCQQLTTWIIPHVAWSKKIYFLVSAELISITACSWLIHLENKNVETVLQTRSTRKVCINFSFS